MSQNKFTYISMIKYRTSRKMSINITCFAYQKFLKQKRISKHVKFIKLYLFVPYLTIHLDVINNC